MRICVLSQGEWDKLPPCDIALLGFGCLGDVYYEREIAGQDSKLEEVVALSKREDGMVVGGCVTKCKQFDRLSCVVASRGKMLGIADMVHTLDDSSFRSGTGLGLYNVGGYKVGVCVDNDLYFPSNIACLCGCGCHLLLATQRELKNAITPAILRSYAYLYGVPIILCAGKVAFFASPTGEIASSVGRVTLFDVDIYAEYHTVTTRQRGLCEGEQDY